mmetsp:Transcript_22148/g.3675  ORF Transcript_22148/g.3675 Transcript_22148/m.3675 type:complete len:97 (-) Transcript_22148:512-802(-)
MSIFLDLVFLSLLTLPLLVLPLILICGTLCISPNEAVVLTFCGKYKGTIRENGINWVNPLYSKQYISLKARNFTTNIIKVNDHSGSPIDIGAVVVW